MTDRGRQRVWDPDTSGASSFSTVQISGVTPVGGKLPVDTEITIEGDVIVQDMDIRSMPLTEVFVSGTPTVQATDFDIRNLSNTQDSVSVIGDINITHPVIVSGVQGTVDTTGNISIVHPVVISGTQNALSITDNGGSITVDASDLDVRNLSHAQDSVSIPQGLSVVSVPPILISGTTSWARLQEADDLVTTIQYNEPSSRITVSGISYSSSSLGLSALETFVSGTNTLLITRSVT